MNAFQLFGEISIFRNRKQAQSVLKNSVFGLLVKLRMIPVEFGHKNEKQSILFWAFCSLERCFFGVELRAKPVLYQFYRGPSHFYVRHDFLMNWTISHLKPWTQLCMHSKPAKTRLWAMKEWVANTHCDCETSFKLLHLLDIINYANLDRTRMIWNQLGLKLCQSLYEF